MERIGEKLRRRREELGFTIEDISRATRYRPETIKAVEEGRAGVFPAEAYNHAFLRAYAEKLKMDPADILREQKSEEERIHDALRGIRLKPKRSPGTRRTIVLALVIVGVAIALLVLYDRVLRPKVGGPVSTDIGIPPAGEFGSQGTAVTDSAWDREPANSSGDSDSLGVGGSDTGPGNRAEMDEVSGRAAPGGGPDVTGDLTPPSEPFAAAAPETAAPGVEGPKTGGSPVDLIPAASKTGVDEPARSDGRDCLEVSVAHYAVKARVFAGDSLIINRWLKPGFREVYCSSEPFWADTIITQAEAILLVLNGEEVPLPEARDNVITDFRISR